MAATSQPRSGGVLVTFLVTALLLVTALAILLRARPELFGIRAPEDPAGAWPHGLPPRPAEPEGPFARYEPRPIAGAIPPSAEEDALVALFRDATPSVCLVSISCATQRSHLGPRPSTCRAPARASCGTRSATSSRATTSSRTRTLRR